MTEWLAKKKKREREREREREKNKLANKLGMKNILASR